MIDVDITVEQGGDVNEPRKILLPRGEVIGIGKFKVKKPAILKLEIPRLSFVLIKESETSFISTCIHLRTDGYGETKEYAILDMIDSAYSLLQENFSTPRKEKAWESLEDWFHCDEWASALWNAYHSVQIEMAKEGRPTDSFDLLEQKIEELEQRVGKLESEEARSLKEKILKYKKAMSLQYGLVGEEAA
jgi:hypothetical protein